MNGGNRVLGRIAIVIVGLLLLVLGAGTALVASLPAASDAWRTVGPALFGPLGTHATPAASSLAWWIVVGASAVVGILAIVVLATRSGSRVDTVLRDSGLPGDLAGDVRIGAAAVQRAIVHALDAEPTIASASVDVYRVRRTETVRVRIKPFGGTDPRALVDAVERVVADLDALLGVRLPVVLHIARGSLGQRFRAR